VIKIRIMYWKEIPVQIEFSTDEKRKSIKLDEKFQVAVDSVSMKDGSFGSDDYLDGWQWQLKEEVDGELTKVLIEQYLKKYDNYPKDLIRRILGLIQDKNRTELPGSIDEWIFKT